MRKNNIFITTFKTRLNRPNNFPKMQAKSIHAQSIHEIQSALDDSMADGFKPTLAFVFISIKNDLDGVIRLLDQAGVQIFGATSSGEFTDGNVSHGSAAILLMDMKPSN